MPILLNNLAYTKTLSIKLSNANAGLMSESNVELVWVTPNAEALVTKMARVSAPKNENNLNTAPRLLRYLIKHKHWSPYEMVNLCVKIKTQRDISAQILRHRSFSYQEFSTRYAKIEDIHTPKLRRQDFKNRQNSIDDLDSDMQLLYGFKIDSLIKSAYDLYNEMLDNEVAKETARRILPLCTNTTLYMNGNLRSWIHYLQLRTHESTQLEHRLIAEKIQSIFTKEFPVISEAAFTN
jgi:thymidylate synthase (FAD)